MRTRTVSAAALCAAFALALSGCVSAHDRALQKTQPYHAGFDDGCAAATASGTSIYGGTVRNDDAYANNEAYRKGWNSGYSNCRPSTPGADRTNSLPVPGPGH